jgi:hypothetical protein
LGAVALGEENVFLLLMICGAFDFWVVKNITGRFYFNNRLMIGMRWWIEHSE